MALLRGEYVYSNNGARILLWQAQTDLYDTGIRCGCGCGRPIVPRKRLPRDGCRDTLDHVWPKNLGGPDKLGNLMLLTRICNDRKAAFPPSEYQVELLKRVNRRLGWPTPYDLFK